MAERFVQLVLSTRIQCIKASPTVSYRILNVFASVVVLVFFGLCFLLKPAAAQNGTIRLQEKLTTGMVVHVVSSSSLAGFIQVGSDKATNQAGKNLKDQRLAVEGCSQVEYHERVLTQSISGSADKVLRFYSRLDYRRKIGDQPQASTLRPAARRRVIWRTAAGQLDSFSPDGPLMWSELDQVKWEIFTPLLAGLLPDRQVSPGDRWQANNSLIMTLTDLETLETGELTCAFRGVEAKAGRLVAVIDFKGVVTGVNADGPNRQRLDGTAYFDLEQELVCFISLSATSWMLDAQQREVGKIDGLFQLTRRRALSPELSDVQIRSLDCEPKSENTWILHYNPDAGLEMQYPRQWHLQKADHRQLILETADGAGLLVTIEPLAQLPTAAQFQQEAVNALTRQSFRILRRHPVRQIAAPPQAIDHFYFETSATDRTSWVFDYYVNRQRAGGATFAARYPAASAATHQQLVEKIARSFVLKDK